MRADPSQLEPQTQTHPQTQPQTQQTDRLLFGGLAAAIMAIITQVIDKSPDLMSSLGIGVVCFALALPLLVASLLAQLSNKSQKNWRHWIDLVGIIFALVGMSSMFFHIHVIAGVAFTCSFVISVMYYVAAR